jgi:hypothetical protein
MLPLDAFSILDYIPCHLIPLRGVSWDAWKCGAGVAPAGAGRTSPRALGRPRVAVRPHYGGLPLFAGWTRTGKGGEIPLEAVPEARPRGHKSPRWSVERRFRGLCSRCVGITLRPLHKSRLSALRLPHFGGHPDKTLTQTGLRAQHRLARSRAEPRFTQHKRGDRRHDDAAMGRRTPA